MQRSTFSFSGMVRKSVLRFFRGTAGSMTVEAVLWVPFFMAVLSIITDAAVLYGGESRALRVIQDGNRAFAVGRFADATATETYIAGEVHGFAPTATVTTTVVDGVITSVVSMPASDLVVFGLIPGLSGISVVVQMKQFQEV
jgi:Flp pilus assembly protein TadG